MPREQYIYFSDEFVVLLDLPFPASLVARAPFSDGRSARHTLLCSLINARNPISDGYIFLSFMDAPHHRLTTWNLHRIGWHFKAWIAKPDYATPHFVL